MTKIKAKMIELYPMPACGWLYSHTVAVQKWSKIIQYEL